MEQQQQTLALVQRAMLGGGLALVVLLVGIVSLVTRWVVVPIREAAEAATRLSDGQLEQRMPVRGTDDLAALARSFNDMAASLQEKLRELEELSQVQRQFVSDVSHELRTPLTTIRIAADVLFAAREDLLPAAARSAELLEGQLERFESLLADLLEISRYDANAATLDAESADVCDLVRRAAADAEQLAARRGTRIDFRLPAEPCVAEVDRRRVERILRNLLDNAVEHGEGRDVVVTVAGDRDAVAVAVRDHGCGFGPGEAQLVFDRFWRADPARARTTGGTGLGLAIAQEDARLHNGWLQAWGEHGKGSRVPAHRAPGGRGPADRLAAAARPGRGRARARAGPVAAGPAPGRGHRAGPARPRIRRPASPTARPAPARPVTDRRRPLLRWLVAALAALAAVAGLRRGSGQRPAPVHQAAGRAGSAQQGQNCCGVVMSPPKPGWNPVQIVEFFILASADYSQGHAIARQYLTPAASSAWQPGPGPAVTVISQAPTVSSVLPPQLNSQKTSIVEITANELGAVSATGQYIPAPDGQKTLTQRFGLRLVSGQWRIDSLPSGSGRLSRELLLTKDFFQLAYQPRNLYYFDPSYKNLVPDPVFLPVNTADPATVLVSALVADPQGWLDGAAFSGFPPAPGSSGCRSRRAARPPSST